MSDENVEKLTKAIVFAFLTADANSPGTIPVPLAAKVAAVLDSCGVVQGEVPEGAEISLPGWILEQSRQQSAPAPVEPDHTAPQPDVSRVGRAPKPPKKISKKFLGEVRGW